MSGQTLVRAEARPHLIVDHVTPYDRFGAWSDDDVERLLASGEQRQELETYFGADEYRELVALAHAACRARPRSDACRAIIVPGILGSQLALPRRPPLTSDVLWLDPVDIGSGRLAELALRGAPHFEPCGVVLYSYLRLKLHLRAAGHDPIFHAYDWRLSIDQLGRDLARRIASEASTRIALVGHSLGGLVSRAALAIEGGERIERVVLLGAPNGGSFAAVQALRGTYAVVRQIARLDAHHQAAALAAEVFSTFPSLWQMLPRSQGRGALDLLDPESWPRSGPVPSAEVLESVRRLDALLAPADERFSVIVGVGGETVTAVTRRGEDFVYTVTRHGDGTVPVACARLDGARHFHATVPHSDLTRDGLVARAVIDLLNDGSTRRLPGKWRTASRALARVSDGELRRLPADKVDWAQLSPEERRTFLQNLNDPPRLRLRVPAQARRSASSPRRR